VPEPVLVQTHEQRWLPVFCYISHSMKPGPVTDGAYVERILRPGRDFGFPQWYIQRLESFRPD
jgi:hypothetical protein